MCVFARGIKDVEARESDVTGKEQNAHEFISHADAHNINIFAIHSNKMEIGILGRVFRITYARVSFLVCMCSIF
jgi:hypothetical protein